MPGHAELADVSLEQAARDGEISTVPVIEVIDAGYKQYHWVSVMVLAFIVLSVTVSFVTLGTGMKHVLDGFVNDSLRTKESRDHVGTPGMRRPDHDSGAKHLGYDAGLVAAAPDQGTPQVDTSDIRTSPSKT